MQEQLRLSKIEARRAARALRSQWNGGAGSISPLTLLKGDPAWESAKTVAAYIPFGAEPPTDGIFAQCHATGRKLAVPVWIASGDVGGYVPAAMSPQEEMQLGPMGIPQPKEPRPVSPEEIDLWIVPGLAFDRFGTRLGHGKGFIDRMLAKRRADAKVYGLAFGWQIVWNELPHDEFDVRMDKIIAV